MVAVTADEVLLVRTDGSRRASAGAPLTADTPIYVASQTKAYIGLLAARLHAEEILSLDSTIADHWPDIEFPAGVDPAAYTMRDLITHTVSIEADRIVELEAYITELSPADYPRLLGEFASRRDEGFAYDNLGYNIYTAILEMKTGRSWRDWLEVGVFAPLGLERTSTRTSDFPAEELAWTHQWLGEDDGWHEIRPKSDAIMQSGGGLVTSPNDMALWLQAQLRGGGSASGDLTDDMFEAAHTISASFDPARPNAYELPCHGYALGWNVCDFEGRTLYIHGGGYTGARTMMAFSPDLGVGVAVFSNSDNMTGWLTSRTVVQFLQYLVDDEAAEGMADRRSQLYPVRVTQLLERRRMGRAEQETDPQWGGWAWSPTSDELEAYVGAYSLASGVEPLRIELDGGTIAARWGAKTLALRPAQPGVFAATDGPWTEFDRFAFVQDDDGAIVAMVSSDWGRFTRIGD